MRRVTAALFAMSLLAVSCGDDTDDAAPVDTTTTAAPTTTAGETTTSTTTASTTTTEAPLPWVQVMADDCECSDGSPYSYWVRGGDTENVMLFFDGGGSCFTAETCDPNGDPTYSISAAEDDPNAWDEGVFDLENPANPVGDWSMIFMPYCTGDVHLGTTPNKDYGDGVVVNHTGFTNASKGLDELVAGFGDAQRVLVTGSSAGGIPVPLFAGHVAEAFPTADVIGLADASGGYPTTPLLNSFVGDQWGSSGAIPDWESTAGITGAEFGIPDLFVYAGTEYPQIRWGRYDNAFDDVQTFFSSLAGLDDPSVKAVLDVNEALVEAAGIDLPVYVAPGTDHTILGSDSLYDLEVEGVAMIDWLQALVDGEPVDDVVCTECDEPVTDDADE